MPPSERSLNCSLNGLGEGGMLNRFSIVYGVTLCDLMDCSPPGSSVHGILQARILEWAAISFSRGSSRPRDRSHVSNVSCIGRPVLYHQHHLGGRGCSQNPPVRAFWNFEWKGGARYLYAGPLTASRQKMQPLMLKRKLYVGSTFVQKDFSFETYGWRPI